MGYSYKKYSHTETAWEIIKEIKEGKITGGNAYNELVMIKTEWKGTPVGDEAEYLIDTMFSEYKFK